MWEQTKRAFLESLERVFRALARLVPGLAAMLLVLAASVVLAAVVRLVVRRVCERLELDRRLRTWGVAAPPAEGRASPSVLVARFATWTVLALGFLVGLGVFDATATSALSLRLLEYVPHALVGLVILAVGIAGSRAVERGVLIGAVNMGLQSAHLLGLGARWLVVVLAGAMALEQLGVGGTILAVAFGLLFGGIVLALSLAVGLGARDVVARSLEKRFPAARKEEGEAKDDLHHL
jgi:hypothetical protein